MKTTLLVLALLLSALVGFAQTAAATQEVTLSFSDPGDVRQDIMGDWSLQLFWADGDNYIPGKVFHLFINETSVQYKVLNRGVWETVQTVPYKWNGSALSMPDMDGQLMLFSCQTYGTKTVGGISYAGMFIKGDAHIGEDELLICLDDITGMAK